jgi:hypothetical protein
LATCGLTACDNEAVKSFKDIDYCPDCLAIARRNFDEDIEDSYRRGRADEQAKILDRIQERIIDLRFCHKNDHCQKTADLIESYIEDWITDEE